MRKKGKFSVKTLLWWLVSLSLSGLSLFAVCENFSQTEGVKKTVCLNLWNVDCFEGGRGSRSAFLKGVANAFYKEYGVRIVVSSLTQEGAKNAFLKGETPDLFSFGLGTDYAAEYVYTVDGKEEIVWCKGGYAIFSKTEDFSSLTEKNTVLSKGGNNLPSVAVALLGYKGKFKVEDSLAAYVKFLNGNYDYLIGTQRDICRFSSRGINVYYKPIEEYCDLNQYVAVTSQKEAENARLFTKFLLREEIQRKLTEISMLSPYYEIYTSGDLLFNLQKVRPVYSLQTFCGMDSLKRIDEIATDVLAGNDLDGLKNFLKRER